MARLRSITTFAVLAALPLALGGCAGALLVGGLASAGGAGYMANQEIGVSGVANDLALRTKIQMAMIKADPIMQKGVSTTVYNGRVLLTGQVATPAMKATAERIAGSEPGVRAVHDEIVVAPREGIWDDTKDAWITAQLRSKLMLDPAVRSVNYTIDTQNGSVYLIGSARDQIELERVTRIARYIPGVKRVVSYVELRVGAPVASVPAMNAGSARPLGPAPMTRPAPQAPIEVQKL